MASLKQSPDLLLILPKRSPKHLHTISISSNISQFSNLNKTSLDQENDVVYVAFS